MWGSVCGLCSVYMCYYHDMPVMADVHPSSRHLIVKPVYVYHCHFAISI